MIRRASLLVLLPIGLFACTGDAPIGPPQDGGADGPGPNDIQGVVVDQFNVPIDGIPVRIDEQLLTTSNGGKFFAPNARAKYDAFTAAGSNGKTSLVGYRELSTRTPTLHVVRLDVPVRTTTFSGTVSGINGPLTACAFTTGFSLQGSAPEPQFKLQNDWYDSTPKTRILVFPTTMPVSGFNIVDTTVSAVAGGQPLGTLTATPTTGGVFRWATDKMGLFEADLVGVDGLACRVSSQSPPPVTVPDVPDATARFTFITSQAQQDVGLLVKSKLAIIGEDFGSLVPPPIAAITSPAKDGSVDESTIVGWQGGSGSYAVRLDCGDYRAVVVTARTSATLPDVKTQNDLLALRPRGSTCTLSLTGTSTRSSTDEWADGTLPEMLSYSSSVRSVKSAP